MKSFPLAAPVLLREGRARRRKETQTSWPERARAEPRSPRAWHVVRVCPLSGPSGASPSQHHDSPPDHSSGQQEDSKAHARLKKVVSRGSPLDSTTTSKKSGVRAGRVPVEEDLRKAEEEMVHRILYPIKGIMAPGRVLVPVHRS